MNCGVRNDIDVIEDSNNNYFSNYMYKHTVCFQMFCVAAKRSIYDK